MKIYHTEVSLHENFHINSSNHPLHSYRINTVVYDIACTDRRSPVSSLSWRSYREREICTLENRSVCQRRIHLGSRTTRPSMIATFSFTSLGREASVKSTRHLTWTNKDTSHARYTSSAQSGKRIRKLIISSKWRDVPIIIISNFYAFICYGCFRHALREYNIHKKLDHIVRNRSCLSIVM